MHRTWIACTLAILALTSHRTQAADLPTSLAIIPGDAAGFVSVDVPGVLNSPLCEEVRFALGGLKPAEVAAFARKFPVDPNTVERAVVVLPNAKTVMEPMAASYPTAVSALAIVGCSKPFDPASLAKGFYPGGRAKSYLGKVYQFDENTWTGLLILPDHRTFVFGTEDSLVWLIDRMAKGDAGPLSAAREEAAGHTIFAAANPAAALPRDFEVPPTLKGLANAQRVCVAIDLGKTIKGSLELHYANAAGAAAGETSLKAALELGRIMLKETEADLQKIIDKPAPGNRQVGLTEFPERLESLVWLGALRRLDEWLVALPVERKGATVRVATEITMPVSVGTIAVAAIKIVTTFGTIAPETFQAIGNSIKPPSSEPAGPTPEEIRLKKLGAAFEAYRAERGHYPPAATYSKDGTPLLSWRVALLPYLGEKKLYGEFRQQEPWDSLHNKKLIAKMPTAFHKPFVYPQNHGKTNAQVFTGRGTLFNGPIGKKPAEKTMILAIEPADDAVAWWTKPADRVFTPGTQPEVFGKYQGSCWALFTDGTVQQLTKTNDEKRLPDLITVPK